MASCSAFATREKSGEITPACLRWLGRDICGAPIRNDRDFYISFFILVGIKRGDGFYV